MNKSGSKGDDAYYISAYWCFFTGHFGTTLVLLDVIV